MAIDPPLLCTSKAPASSDAAAPHDSARSTTGVVRRAASTTAGQKPMRNIAAWAFQ